DPVPGTLDVHLGHTGAFEPLGHRLTDLHVLGDVVLVELVRVPARLPVRRDAEPEPGWVNFLPHYSVSSSAFVAFLAAAFFAGLVSSVVAAVVAFAAFFAVLVAGAVGVSSSSTASALAAFVGAAFDAAFAGAALAGPAFAGAALVGPAVRPRRPATTTLSTSMVMWHVR